MYCSVGCYSDSVPLTTRHKELVLCQMSMQESFWLTSLRLYPLYLMPLYFPAIWQCVSDSVATWKLWMSPSFSPPLCNTVASLVAFKSVGEQLRRFLLKKAESITGVGVSLTWLFTQSGYVILVRKCVDIKDSCCVTQVPYTHLHTYQQEPTVANSFTGKERKWLRPLTILASLVVGPGALFSNPQKRCRVTKRGSLSLSPSITQCLPLTNNQWRGLEHVFHYG